MGSALRSPFRRAFASARRRGTAAGFTAIVLWSTTVALVRSLSERVGPLTAAAAVYGVSGAAALIRLLCVRERRGRIARLPRRYLIGCGALFGSYTLILYLAVGWAADRQQVLEVAILNYLWPALTILLSVALLGHKTRWLLIPATVLALTGVFLVLTQGTTLSWQSVSANLAAHPAPYVLGLVAAWLWAFHSTLTRKWAEDQAGGGMDVFLVAAALLLLVASLGAAEPRAWSPRAGAEAVFLGLSTYAGYALWDRAMRTGNVASVAAASYLTPLFSTLVSVLYLGVTPGPRLWAGCAVLVTGSVLSWRSVSGPNPWTRR